MKERVKKLLESKLVRQFVSYVIVGASATLVEWLFFWILDGQLHIGYLLATALAFAIATAANWALGRLLTFRGVQTKDRRTELIQIYAVSVVGLLANLGLMALMVQGLSLPRMLAKIIATFIVFGWNFLSRKLWIYKV